MADRLVPPQIITISCDSTATPSAPLLVLPSIVTENLPTTTSILDDNKKKKLTKSRSYSVDDYGNNLKGLSHFDQQKSLSLACLIKKYEDSLAIKTDKLSLNTKKLVTVVNNAATTLSVPRFGSNLLKLPNDQNSQSKLSLNFLTPAGSIYDVSDTNSMIFNKNNEDEDVNTTTNNEVTLSELSQQQQLSKYKLSQLDEQIATNYKLKCKNWLQNIINTPT